MKFSFYMQYTIGYLIIQFKLRSDEVVYSCLYFDFSFDDAQTIKNIFHLKTTEPVLSSRTNECMSFFFFWEFPLREKEQKEEKLVKQLKLLQKKENLLLSTLLVRVFNHTKK